jgi:hypothetical protein
MSPVVLLSAVMFYLMGVLVVPICPAAISKHYLIVFKPSYSLCQMKQKFIRAWSDDNGWI